MIQNPSVSWEDKKERLGAEQSGSGSSLPCLKAVMPNGMRVVSMVGMGSDGCAGRMAGITVMLGRTGRFWNSCFLQAVSCDTQGKHIEKALLCFALQTPL